MSIFSSQKNPKVVFILLVFANLFCAAAPANKQKGTASSQRLYLLAATPHVEAPYPVTLYEVDEYKRLDSVREVIGHSEGADQAYASGNLVFFTYPRFSPTSVAIVHMDDPARTDNIAFRSKNAIGSPPADLAEPPGRGLELLLSWITTPIVPGQPLPPHPDVANVSVSGSGRRGPRVQANRWADYAYLRLEGQHGGPTPAEGEGEVAFAQGGNVVLRDFNHPVVIDVLPAALTNLADGTSLFIFASTDRYLLFLVRRDAADVRGMRSANLGKSMKVYVHDRVKNQWNTVQTEGNDSTLRLFGSWVAEIVANGSPNHPPNPGRESERTWDEQTENLPPTQRLYEQGGGALIARPGVLLLLNLANGRKIRIETDQEDSEILWADDDSLLYRVNDQIYEANITGDKVQDARMIVQDQDVPEVDWAFWGK